MRNFQFTLCFSNYRNIKFYLKRSYRSSVENKTLKNVGGLY